MSSFFGTVPALTNLLLTISIGACKVPYLKKGSQNHKNHGFIIKSVDFSRLFDFIILFTRLMIKSHSSHHFFGIEKNPCLPENLYIIILFFFIFKMKSIPAPGFEPGPVGIS